MKNLTFFTAIMVSIALFTVPGFADSHDKREYLEKKERYEMLQPEGKAMKYSGDYRMIPCIKGKTPDDCWMGWHGNRHDKHHHHWMYGGMAFAKVLLLGFFFWMLFSIHKSLKKIADSKEKE
ncbi:MAG: hypothetical protein OEV42_20400 [Deltaproteobacteria bacterium]|nr:hypothetical protein [Deltaproteobacteria bacterium]